MDVILEKLYAIRMNPAIYVGGKSFYLLKPFIDGYMDRAMELDPDFESLYSDFHDYIREQYKMAPNYCWDRILTAYSSTDEEAFDLFYAYLDKYLESKGVDASTL